MEFLPDKRIKRKQIVHGVDECSEQMLRRVKAARIDKTTSCHVAATTGDGEPQRTASQKRARILWEDGVRLQKDGRLDEAYKAFTKALILCSCHSQTRRKFKEAGAPISSIDPVGHCTCKDFVAAAQTRRRSSASASGGGSLSFSFPMSELDLDAVYALATSRGCHCGSDRVRCAEPTHLELVDRLALVAAKLGRPTDALRLAQYVVDLAPHRPEGYLHLAKAAADAQSDALRARFLARCVYTHGLHNVRRYGDASVDGRLAKVLAHCCKKYGHDDYIPLLPVETVEMIFRHLSLTDLLACCRVSKTWASVLCNIRIRLRRVALLGAGCPQPKLLVRLLRRFPRLETNELTIFYATKIDRLPLLAAVALHHFSSLQDLSIALPETLAANGTIEDVLRTDVLRRSQQQLPLQILSRCRRLHLGNIQPSNARAALNLLACAAPSLEWLTLEGRGASAVTFPLPRLVGLQVLSIDWSLAPGWDLLPSLCAAAPRLQQLSLSEVALKTAPGESGPAGYDAATALQSLQVLVVRRKFRSIEPATRRPDPDAGGLFPLLPAQMRCVDICSVDDYLTKAILASLSASPQLELFRCQSSLLDDRQPEQNQHHQQLFELLSPSLNGGMDPDSPTGGVSSSLESLEISGEGREQALLHDPRFAIPCPDRLRNVGLYHVDWDPDPGLPGYVPGRTALQWLAQFRRAEVVSIYLRDERQGPALLLALVESIAQARQQEAKPDEIRWGDCLRIIYDGSPTSVVRDRAVQMAADLGIDVLWSPDGRPSVFPWPAKEDMAGAYTENM